MMRQDFPAGALSNDLQHARMSFRIGKRTALKAEVDVTSSGLLAIGALVSMILLSTAVIVRTARH